MLAVNGLKFVFGAIERSKIDDQVERSFNTLIMMAKANEMISFMISFNVTEVILNRLKPDYTFIIFLLELTKTLLKSEDYLRSQKSLLEWRRLFDLYKDE